MPHIKKMVYANMEVQLRHKKAFCRPTSEREQLQHPNKFAPKYQTDGIWQSMQRNPRSQGIPFRGAWESSLKIKLSCCGSVHGMAFATQSPPKVTDLKSTSSSCYRPGLWTCAFANLKSKETNRTEQSSTHPYNAQARSPQ